MREVWIEISRKTGICKSMVSLPVREVWIEIKATPRITNTFVVTSREGSVD